MWIIVRFTNWFYKLNLLSCTTPSSALIPHVSVYICLFVKYFIHTIISLAIATLLFHFLSGKVSVAHNLIRTLVYKQMQEKKILWIYLTMSRFSVRLISVQLFVCLPVCQWWAHGSIADPGVENDWYSSDRWPPLTMAQRKSQVAEQAGHSIAPRPLQTGPFTAGSEERVLCSNLRKRNTN